jgi:hypothetical protein
MSTPGVILTAGLWKYNSPRIKKRLFVKAIESGRLHHDDEAVKEALSLWEERERRRVEIVSAVDEAEASLARDEGRPVTQQSMGELAEDVKRQGRARLMVEQQPLG